MTQEWRNFLSEGGWSIPGEILSSQLDVRTLLLLIIYIYYCNNYRQRKDGERTILNLKYKENDCNTGTYED